jgi:hypothetical protein
LATDVEEANANPGRRALARPRGKAVVWQTGAQPVHEAQAAHPQAASRLARGAKVAKCALDSPFRECRGGDALVEDSFLFQPFDQYHYAAQHPIDGRGVCAGWVREAMRRIDQSNAAVPPSLLDVAHRMSTDATRRRSGVADAQFGRVVAFQLNASSLGLRRFELRATERFNRESTRIGNINSMMHSLGNGLRENEMAFVRLALNPRGSTEGELGHALLVQRLPDDEYMIFDPNNGAFLYENREEMQDALRNYMNEAFSEPELGLEVMANSIQYFAPTALGHVERPLPQSTPLLEPRPLLLPRADSSTREIYHAPAAESNDVSSAVLVAAAGERRRRPDVSHALAYYALRDVARGRAPDLTDATEDLWGRLSDRARRSDFLQEISRLGAENRYGVLADMPNRTRRPGSFRMNTASALLDDLRLHFGGSRDPEDARVPYRNDFAELRLTFRNPPGDVGESSRGAGSEAAGGHSIVVQRRGQADGFEHDAYDLYEPDIGVFRYGNFAELSEALQGVMERGYPERGGIVHTDSVYFGHYDDEPLSPHVVPTTPAPHESRAANMEIGQVERALGITGNPSQTPPHANLSSQPDFGFPEPPETLQGVEADSSRDDLKRSPNYAQDRKPFALYRPSTITPAELAQRGGFESDHTVLRNVNLDMHDFDVASNRYLIDSAGYLGTFRRELTAAACLPAKVPLGFIYYVAPTPNMVDVNASLDWQSRKPGRAEVAAMGRIDYTQIRGWRVVKNGVAGKFIRNPDYRWDVYNQTRTAGSQPMLSRLPVTSDTWRGPLFSAFVSTDSNGEIKGFNQDLNRLHAYFYDNAWEKVRGLQSRQASGLDYRGPLTIEAYGGNDSWGTHLYIDPSGSPVVASRSRTVMHSASKHEFTMGDDGRLHLADDYEKVLRVGSDGYVYLGGIPSNLNSTNGVFEYARWHLIHREDGKYLTTGRSVYTPFVTQTNEGVRSAWALHRPDHRPANPPQNHEYSFWGMTGGRRQLYLFEADPDVALPEGVTHFVTKVPGNTYTGNFLGYVDSIHPAEVRAASKWLHGQGAAWLFRDGFYLMPRESGHLEARTLDGVLHWWTESDPESGAMRFRQTTLSSNYRIGDQAWQQVRQSEDRHERLFALLD